MTAELLVTSSKDIVNDWISIPNGLNVVMKSGEEKKFSLKKRNEIGAMINKMY